MQKLNLLYICDERFAGIAGISITSLFENNGRDKIALEVYILAVNVSKKNRELFAALAQKYEQTIHIINAINVFKELEELGLAKYRGSSMTNLRLFFDLLIPEDIHKLLYLDCDTIICNTLTGLAEFDMHQKMLGMAIDAYGNLFKEADDPYYNAGVMLIDCDKWKTGHWREKITQYIQENRRDFCHPDQDLYNIVCKSEIVRIPIQYNHQPVHRMQSAKVYLSYLAPEEYYSIEEIESARYAPVILHMIRVFGENPWHKGSIHPDTSIFIYYKNLSLWKDMQAIPRHHNVIFGIEKILYRMLPENLFFPLSVLAIKLAVRKTEL